MLQGILDFVLANENVLGMAVLFLSAITEYLFPPFPGDTVTLFGAFLITAHGWSFLSVLTAVTAGSLLGATGDYYLGVLLASKGRRSIQPKIKGKWKHLETLVARFRRHGEVYIVVNRFLPGIRAAFFYAAGFAGMRLSRVLFFALLSSLAWNLLLIAVGATIGANWERIVELVQDYTVVMWVVIATVVGLALARWGYLRHRRKAAESAAGEKENG